MLPARYRMTRSADFGLTVNKGVRAVQPDLVVHALHASDDEDHADCAATAPSASTAATIIATCRRRAITGWSSVLGAAEASSA